MNQKFVFHIKLKQKKLSLNLNKSKKRSSKKMSGSSSGTKRNFSQQKGEDSSEVATNLSKICGDYTINI